MGLLVRSGINLAITLVLLQYLARCAQADTIDVKSSSLASPKPEPFEGPKITSGKLAEAKSQNDGEILETASSMVFRPLFVYRQQQAQRRRVYDNSNKGARRNDGSSYYPYGYPSYGYPNYGSKKDKPKKPVRKHHGFPAVF